MKMRNEMAKYLTDSELTVEKCTESNPIAGILCTWILCVNDIYILNTQRQTILKNIAFFQ